MKINKFNNSIANYILNSDKMSFCLVGVVGSGKSEIMNIIHNKKNIKSFKFDYYLYKEYGLDKYKKEIINFLTSIIEKENIYEYLLIELEMLSDTDITNLREKVLNRVLKECRKINCKVIISLYPEQEFEWHQENIQVERII